MKSPIRKITSPSHTLESEIKELADENGQYLAKTGLGDTTTDVMDRDLVIFIQSEDNNKPKMDFYLFCICFVNFTATQSK